MVPQQAPVGRLFAQALFEFGEFDRAPQNQQLSEEHPVPVLVEESHQRGPRQPTPLQRHERDRLPPLRAGLLLLPHQLTEASRIQDPLFHQDLCEEGRVSTRLEQAPLGVLAQTEDSARDNGGGRSKRGSRREAAVAGV